MITDPTPNIPLLRKCVEWAEAEAAKPTGGMWNQEVWASETECGTAFCIAGYACAIGVPGAKIAKQPWLSDIFVELHIDGEWASWSDTGQEILGLTDDEADDLFDSDNTVADVRRIAERIASEAL
jgi:hypothetical protein